MDILIPTTSFPTISKLSFYPSSFTITRRPRSVSEKPNSPFLIPFRTSFSSHQGSISNAHQLNSESRVDCGGDSTFIEVIGIGSRKDAVLDFCSESPFQSSSSLRFWSIQLKDSGEVQLLQTSRQDTTLRNVESPVSQLSSARAIVLVASAGYGVDHVTAVELLREIKLANGLAIGIILKPFNFEGLRRQDEVNDLVTKISEHTHFCIVVDTDELLKREMVTLAEALRSANNAVLLAMNAISILMSDMHEKLLDQPDSKTKELKVPDVVELLESCKEAKVGFGAGNNMKLSIARAVFDCPFVGDDVKENKLVFCTISSCDVIENKDMHAFLQTFRRTTGFKNDIVISSIQEPNMEKNLILTTLITLCSNERDASQKHSFLSSLVLRLPFVSSLLGKGYPDKGTLATHSQGSTIINSSDSTDPPEMDSVGSGDESHNAYTEEMDRLPEDSSERSGDLSDKNRKEGSLKRKTKLLPDVYDQISDEPAIQREAVINRNVGPGFHLAQEWAKERAISGAGPVLETRSSFALPVGVKPSGQPIDSQQSSNTVKPDRSSDHINGRTQGSPDTLSWDAITDVYNAASSILKTKYTNVPRKEGVLSSRAASMLEAERDSEKKWSPNQEIPYRGGIYKGRCQGGLPEGKGRLTLPDGSIYDGMWRYGKRYGLGTFYYSNGDVFQGSWRDDLMHGRGWFYFRTGDRWYVNFWKGKANGEGRFYSRGGEIFFGSFQDDWRHGQGLFIDVEGRRWTETWDEGILLSRKQLDSAISAE